MSDYIQGINKKAILDSVVECINELSDSIGDYPNQPTELEAKIHATLCAVMIMMQREMEDPQ